MTQAFNFYLDTRVVEILSNDKMTKSAQAGLASQIVSKVSDYVSNHITDPNNPSASIINMLGPGLITITLRAMGFNIIGLLIGTAASIFHFDFAELVSSIWGHLKELISGNKKTTSAHIDSAVQSAVNEHLPTTEEARPVTSAIRDARFVSLALIKDNSLVSLGANPAVVKTLLARILGWIFKVAFASAGLLVAGDVINNYVGRQNAFQEKIKPEQDQKPKEEQSIPEHVSTQTKFKLRPGYIDSKQPKPWFERILNNRESIADMLVSFAKQAYSGLDSLESNIRSANSFNELADRIAFYNHTSEGDNFVYIPPNFTTKKHLVDTFIDEVAENTK